MNDGLLLRVSAPAVFVGATLLLACLAGVAVVNRIHADLAEVIAENVVCLEAAQELEISVRQLRQHSLLYLMDPSPARLEPIRLDPPRFEAALNRARAVAPSDDERGRVETIAAGYARYRAAWDALRARPTTPPSAAAIAAEYDSLPIRYVVDPCQELLRANRERIEATAREAHASARWASAVMLALGVIGAVGGVVLGFGVARAIRRSVFRLSVRARDIARQLDAVPATVDLVADGDLGDLDSQMGAVVVQVERVMGRLQQQQRELLRAEQLAAVGQLAAGVAHEVRNPLAGVAMLVDAARRSDHPRPLDADDLTMIHRELGRVERTVQGLLDYARLPTPQRAACELGDLVEPVVALFAARAASQGVSVVTEVAGSAVADADREQLHTALVNLVINALDAMPTGGTLTIVAGATSDAAWLEVHDTGPGIPPALAVTLFEPFVTSKPTGTGLGLSLVRRIAEEHGGQVTAATGPGGGACLRIELPARREASL